MCISCGPAVSRRSALTALGGVSALFGAAALGGLPANAAPVSSVGSLGSLGASSGPGSDQFVDVHSHFVTDRYVAAAIAAGHITPDGMPGWPSWNVGEHLELMDSAGISKSILSISSPGVHFGNDADARALARELNEFSANVVGTHPTRFGHFASLPLPDVNGAIAEAVHALDNLNADGVTMLSNSAGIYLGDDVLIPLLTELDRRGATVFVHPTSPPGQEAISLKRPRPLIEFLFDSARTIVDLIMTDRLEQFPNINWIVTHGGGVLPLVADRVDLFKRLFGGNDIPAQTLLSRLWFDIAGTPFPRQAPALVDLVGTEQILYGSDYCFTPPPAVAAQVQSIDTATPPNGWSSWRALTLANARRLLPEIAPIGR